MKYIPLSRGLCAIIDDEDYEFVSRYSWRVSPASIKGRENYYAIAHVPKTPDRPRTTVYMHRLILGVTDRWVFADHISGDGLDNRRSNLRQATPGQNTASRINNGSLRGARRTRNGIRWIACISHNRRRLRLGTFETPEEAARAYDQAALELYGEFACLNFPSAPDRTARRPTQGAVAV